MAEVKSKTEMVAQFNNGNTGWCKIAIERDTNYTVRGHLALWVQHGSSKVAVNAIEMGGYVSIEQWCSRHNFWHIRNYKNLYYTDTTPPETTNQYTSWSCAFPFDFLDYPKGGGLNKMRAVAYNFRIKSGAQWCDWKTRITESWDAYSGQVCQALPQAPGHP